MSSPSLALLLCDQLKQRCQPPYAEHESAIVEVLRALRTCDVSVELLHSTRVGVLLNSVRRELSDDGAALARQLIAQWKEVARSSTAAATAIVPAPASSGTGTLDVSGQRDVSRSVSSPPSSASDALRASSERRKRKAADMLSVRSVIPQPAARAADSLSDLSSSSYTQLALSPVRPAAYYSDALTQALPLYNPNHHSQQSQIPAAASGQPGEAEAEPDVDGSGSMEAEVETGAFDLTAKFRRRHTTDVDMAGSSLPLPTSAVCVCSLQQMCVDHLAQPAVVNQLAALPPLPQPLLLAVLQRASAACLRRVQAASGWIKEADLDELWKAAASRRWGKQAVGEEEEARRARGRQQASWRDYHDKREKEKESKLSQLGLRLKARVEEERREKKEKQGVRTMDLMQATKQLEKRGRKRQTSSSTQAAAGGAGGSSGGGISRSSSGGHTSVAAADKRTVVNRLSAMRKEAGGVSQRFWSARPNG